MIKRILKWIGVEWIYGQVGDERTLYLLRIPLSPGTRLGGLYLHIFLRGDADPDCHDHPWSFWTFPLHTYAEEFKDTAEFRNYRTVRRFHFQYRPANYAHRVLGRWNNTYLAMRLVGGRDPCMTKPGRIVTLVWHGPKKRDWGFWVDDRWIPWRAYVRGIHEG